MKIDNTVSAASILQKKTREQLLDEYADIKENSYYRAFSVSSLVIIVVLVKTFFSANTAFLLPLIFMSYLAVEILLYVGRINRKLEKLYEIEKERFQK